MRSVFVTLLLVLALLTVCGAILRTQASDDAVLALICPAVGAAMWLLRCTLPDGGCSHL